jgi:hypothetical protein
MKVNIDNEIKLVTVKDQSVQDTISAAGYPSVVWNILQSETMIHDPGSRYMGTWSPISSISSEDADKVIKSITTVIDGQTYQARNATIEELASYQAIFNKELENETLVALTEEVVVSSSECGKYHWTRHVRSCSRWGLHFWAGDWAKTYSFLVVFEKVEK